MLLNYHLERLRRERPSGRRRSWHGPFVDDVLAAAGEPLELEYVRLNIDARAA